MAVLTDRPLNSTSIHPPTTEPQGPLGANVNAMTIGGGMTPLHCCAVEGRTAMVPMLAARGADPFVRNQEYVGFDLVRFG